MCYAIKVTGGSMPSYYLGDNAMKATTIDTAKKFNSIDDAEYEADIWLSQMYRAEWADAETEIVEVKL